MIEISKMSSDEWAMHAELAHKVVFGENRPAEMNRIDFALMAHNGPTPLTYGTYREVDSQTIYMQYGGAFPGTEKTALAWHAYSRTIDELQSMGYKYATTLIENDNIPMLKFAMKKGFRVIGVRTFEGKILCELLKTFNQEG